MPFVETMRTFACHMVGGEEKKVLAVAEGLAMLMPVIFGRNELAQLTCLVGLMSTFLHAGLAVQQTFETRD